MPPEDVEYLSSSESSRPSGYDEHRAPGSRAKQSLEERQAEMAARLRANPLSAIATPEQAAAVAAKRRVGNPNLQKGVRPYNIAPQSFQAWLDDHSDYSPTRKNGPRVADVVQMFLKETPRADNPQQKQRLHLLLEALFRAATNQRSPLAVQAALALLNRAYGKEQAADADLDAIKKGGLTVVYVDRQQQDPDIPVVSESQHALPAPEFIDAEVIDDER